MKINMKGDILNVLLYKVLYLNAKTIRGLPIYMGLIGNIAMVIKTDGDS